MNKFKDGSISTRKKYRDKSKEAYENYSESDIRELRRLERMDDGFKDEENTKNKKAGSSISPLGGSDAYYFHYDDPEPKFEEVVSLQFQPVGKIYWYHYPEVLEENNTLKQGDIVVAFSERGMELAQVLEKSRELFEKQDKINFIKGGIIRKAKPEDFKKAKKLQEKAAEARSICERINRDLDIMMKIIRVKYTLDDSKVIVYFTANGRVDFRELIKRLAFELRRRIEMRQIGVRDTTKIMGGMGPCGMKLCCNRFLHSFASVSIKMAKDQNLSLNPTKISGICGRLFCCLSYEQEGYEQMRKDYPEEESQVKDKVSGRIGTVKKVNVIQKNISVEFFDRRSKRPEEKVIPQDAISRDEEGKFFVADKPALPLLTTSPPFFHQKKYSSRRRESS